MTRPSFKAAIFDLDGTLADSVPDLHAASEKLLVKYGCQPLGQNTIRSFVGNGIPALIALVSEASGLPTDPRCQSEFVTEFVALYDEALTDHTTLYPGVRSCLEGLYASGIALAVCTNKPEAQARQVLQNLGLASMFQAVVGGDSLRDRKPSPVPLLAALSVIANRRGQNLAVDDCLFIGDSEVDAATAKAAGMACALHKNGYRNSPLEDLEHDYAFDLFGDLTSFVLSPQTGQGQSARALGVSSQRP